MLVTKLDGTTEEFDENKLKSSLFHAGATESVADDIVRHIERELTPGVTTSHIYKHAKQLLRKQTDHPVAARYSLRRAILELGPSGYPFERILGEVFRLQGYHVEVGQMLRGRCVEHEVDVVARGNGKLILGEAKFHNNQGFKTDVKVALYIHARFLDLQSADFGGMCPPSGTCESWLMTNTKFTDAAIRYGECVGITMIGWGYPKKGNVQDLIEQTGLHPISSLTTLSKKEKELLYVQGMVLCRNITENPNVLESIGITGRKVEQILAEAHRLCVPAA
jgi:hypothetical protein